MSQPKSASLLCVLLVAITLVLYWPARQFDFTNYDDPDYILYNPAIQHGITSTCLKWAFKSGYASNWHPLTWISHTLDYSAYGQKAGGHHLTNLLFHAANTALLFLVLLQMTGSHWRSALVAALFAWHPLHVESVAWVSERKDVLSTFFWLLTMLAYVGYTKAKGSSSFKTCGFYSLALVCFILGLLAKPMVVTLPFVLLLLDYWPLRRFGATADKAYPLASLILEKAPFLILSVLDSIATFWAQKNSNAVVSQIVLPIHERISNALVSYVLYLWKTIWPTNLALPYSYSHAWTVAQVTLAGISLLAVSIIGFLLARKHPWLLVGWLWFLGTLVPVIGLIQVGIQFMADRYTYLPLIGIFIMAVWSIPAHWARWPRPGLIFSALVGAMLVFLLTATETQLGYWRNSMTLFSHTVQLTEGNILAEYNLAEALARNGDDDQAILHYQKTLAIVPNRVEAQYNSQSQAHFNLGLLYRVHKRWPEAAEQFRACIQEEPKLAQNHANLGIALLGIGKTNEAFQEFHAASGNGPDAFDQVTLLSLVDSALGETGHYAAAIEAAQRTREAALATGKKAAAADADKRIEAYRKKLPSSPSR